MTMTERLLVPVWPDAAEMLGIGETLMRSLVATGEIPTVRIGRKRLVRIDDLLAYVERLSVLPDVVS